jgi:hypothetical protein
VWHIFMPLSISGHVCKPENIAGRGHKRVPGHSTRNTRKCKSGHTHSGGLDGRCCDGGPPN